MRIFILGYKSSGKTTLGKHLAPLLGLSFIDLDDYIEKLHGKTVPDIYSNDGEKAFRKIEHEALLQLCLNFNNVVVSTGGGAPCWHNNMDIMLEKGETIYIKLNAETLVKRLSKATNRPIIKNKTTEQLFEYLSEIKQEREPFFQKAKYHIEANNLSVKELVSEVLKIFN